MRLIASATTECARAFASCGRFLRLPRFLPLGQPPSLAFSLDDLALAFDFTLPSSAPTLISFPQCGHFICPEYRTVTYVHDEFQKTPLPIINFAAIRARHAPVPEIESGTHWATGKSWARSKSGVEQWGDTQAEAISKVVEFINRHA